jgi:hypothetical protein
LSKHGDQQEEFYAMVTKNRSASFESIVLLWSTVFLSFSTPLIGIAIHFGGQFQWDWITWLFIASGTTGLILSKIIQDLYQSQKATIQKAVAKEVAKTEESKASE